MTLAAPPCPAYLVDELCVARGSRGLSGGLPGRVRAVLAMPHVPEQSLQDGNLLDERENLAEVVLQGLALCPAGGDRVRGTRGPRASQPGSGRCEERGAGRDGAGGWQGPFSGGDRGHGQPAGEGVRAGVRSAGAFAACPESPPSPPSADTGIGWGGARACGLPSGEGCGRGGDRRCQLRLLSAGSAAISLKITGGDPRRTSAGACFFTLKACELCLSSVFFFYNL